MVKTSGRVPAAKAAVKVEAVQLYSSGSTVTHGYLASNSLIWRFSASVASCVAPGRSTPTEMVTGLWVAVAGAALAPATGVPTLSTLGAGVLVVEQAPTVTIVNATAASVLNMREGLTVISSLTLMCGPFGLSD